VRCARVRRRTWAAAVATAALGCGARSGLESPETSGRDTALDAANVRDATSPPSQDVTPEPQDALRAPDVAVEDARSRDAWSSDAWSPDAWSRPADVCIELPPAEPPRSLAVSYLTRITSSEVYFLVDLTGSMRDELAQIRASLRDVIVPGIVAAIPGARFSVGHFTDFPFPPYGADTYELVGVAQPSTRDIGAVQAAVDGLEIQGGGDQGEATLEALYASARGSGVGPYAPPASCPVGTVGYPCFAPDGSRIVLLFTDAPFHNGPDGTDRYGSDVPVRTRTYPETVEALREIGAKVLGLYSGPLDGGYFHVRGLSVDTGAVRSDGTPVFFDIGLRGESLGTDVVAAVRSLVEDVPIDVDLVIEDGSGDDVNATTFVVGVRTIGAEPAGGAVREIDRYLDTRPGTRVHFAVDLANERFEVIERPQIFRLVVVVRGDGVTRLEELHVDIVVPGWDGRGCPRDP